MFDSLGVLDGPTLTLILAGFFILASVQTIHAFSLTTISRSRVTGLEVVCEALLSIHCMIMSAYVFSYAMRNPDPVFDLFFLDVPFSLILWANAFICIACIAACIQTRSARLVPECVFLISCTPFLDELPVSLVLADLSYFAFRAVYRMLTIRTYRQSALVRTSTESAVNKLPDGVLYMRNDGRVSYMNEAMRKCLDALGLPCGCADARTIWPELVKRYGKSSGGAGGADFVRVRVSEDEVRYFVLDQVVVDNEPSAYIIAYDATQAELLGEQIRQANEQLEQTSAELNEQLAEVSNLADNAAVLHMRSQVHDVIGQRLSILHRYLEDGNISDETIAKIEPLLSTMLDEIAEGVNAKDDVEERLTLENVVNAFAVIGVSVHARGKQPEDDQVALAFTRIIREASTNAVRHGQATRVYVAFARDARNYWLTISNDGFVPDHVSKEGSGMRGMRTTAELLGGSFSYRLDPRFTIEVSIPRRKGGEQ